MRMDVVVYTEIVGDVIHCGHVEFLRLCRKLGDVLIVGVSSDELVDAMHKLQATNIKIKHSLSVVDACSLVDLVIQDCPSQITVEFLKLHKISVVVCGFDVHPSDATRLYDVPFELGILRFVQTPDVPKAQTEHMLKRRYACSECLATRLPHRSIDNCADLTQTRIERMLIRLERACRSVLP